MTARLPTVSQAKELARRLRAEMSEDGTLIGHAKSLEIVAHRHGFRDWNSMSAAISNALPSEWKIGDNVSGKYLSQPFTAVLVAIEPVKAGWLRVELKLDQAVDVVRSDGFSNFRTRVRGVIGPKGHSEERTSDGEPHLQIDPVS